MIDISAEERRTAFSIWLRTGRRPTIRPDGVELKFNPYHDPRNGRFTFAPGGPRSLSDVIISDRRLKAKLQQTEPAKSAEALGVVTPSPAVNVSRDGQLSDAVYRPEQTHPNLQPAQFIRNPQARRGGNSGEVPYDPVVLAQVFPRLQAMPGGSIVAVADGVLGLSAPMADMYAAWAKNMTNILVNDINRLDPKFHYESFGFPPTVEGQTNQLNELRMIRAAKYVQVKGELRPMQVEVLRLMQRTADRAYNEGLALLRAGKLKSRISKAEALGSYIDHYVRLELRNTLRHYGVDEAGSGTIRVNRRENSGSDTTYRRPDARIGKVAYDVTLTEKTLKTPQVRGFFNTDFEPNYTIIIRPSQLGKDGKSSTYIIKRPGQKQ